jgi:solute carrier family 12 sodium/potassium/chloride transporter 2
MNKPLVNQKAKFGTLEVFTTSISTILGAILFLRFGYAIGNIGFWGTIGIIILGHLVTVPTAMAVAEIATNQRVLGGGAYYIISRSFGLNVGAAIGITLYLSQAISVAFYIIAFSEAFDPVIHFIHDRFHFLIPDKRFISLPFMAIISVIVIVRGANLGMKALYGVVLVLFTSLLLFFVGTPENPPLEINFYNGIAGGDNFFIVFAIIFPAFTGLAAGLGLSGDLKDPTVSIPRGTILATIVGGIVYIGVAYKLIISASINDLADDQLIMQKIAYWGPIIPIGLAAASLSSALGSILVAPRTLQAIGADNVFPNNFINRWLGFGKTENNEPVHASLISIIIAFFFIAIGDINFVAKIISMFFVVTYGAICLISFLEHFAADPSYRPRFKSKWYFSLLGALLSLWLMFKMNGTYAFLSLAIMALIYYMISEKNAENVGLGKLFRGVIFQLSRQLQIFVQRADKEDPNTSWRPFIICVSSNSFKRMSAFDLLRWISYKYGFGTYIHYIEGYLSKQTSQESKEVLERLIKLASYSQNKVYLDTIISPSYTSAIAQVAQLSGITGRGNNMILFEFSRNEPDELKEALNNYSLVHSAGFDVCVLNTSLRGFGNKREIDIWITTYDYENANLMILLGYIILGHPEWKRGHIKIFAIYKEEEIKQKQENLLSLIKSGRLPIAPGNIELIPSGHDDIRNTISEKSLDADLTIVGFRHELVKVRGIELFNGYNDVGNILFVCSQKEKEIR